MQFYMTWNMHDEQIQFRSTWQVYDFFFFFEKPSV